MPQDADALFTEAERAELEHVVEALAKSPRLSRLLQYMGEKHFSGAVDQLTEYNIAIEVFGRSKTVFNAADDAIARVEAHRLRKRLAAFYETEGADRAVQVTLPAGSYVPVFIHKPARTSEDAATATETARSESRNEQGWFRNPRPLVIAATIVVVLLVVYLLRPGKSSKQATPAVSASPSAVTQGQPNGSAGPIRLLAGYSGPPRTDSAGRVWLPDQYFAGGGNWRRTPGPMARTSDPFLFEYSRTGDFAYSIPLPPGSYEVHLRFSTPLGSNESIASFIVWLNGKIVLDAFDINADALGPNIADERVFRDISPDKDGFVRLGFTGATGPATLNAIEILPGLPHAQLPIRLIMQQTPFTDTNGRVWHPDNYYMNGRLSGPTRPLLDSPTPDLFSGERYGHFTYAVPVDTRGRYTLVLHFAEFYFGTPTSGTGGVGSRVFKVMCNGETLLDDLDLYKEAGALHEVTKTFRHLKPTAQGKLNLTFEPIKNNATISGIEVLDESE